MLKVRTRAFFFESQVAGRRFGLISVGYRDVRDVGSA